MRRLRRLAPTMRGGSRFAAALLIAAILIGSGTAWAAEYTAFGGGNKSCGLWTKAKEEDGAVRRQFEQWIGGYLTAYSQWIEIGSGPVSYTDHIGANAWIDNYCRDNPLDWVAIAALELIRAIKAK